MDRQIQEREFMLSTDERKFRPVPGVMGHNMGALTEILDTHANLQHALLYERYFEKEQNAGKRIAICLVHLGRNWRIVS